MASPTPSSSLPFPSLTVRPSPCEPSLCPSRDSSAPPVEAALAGAGSSSSSVATALLHPSAVAAHSPSSSSVRRGGNASAGSGVGVRRGAAVRARVVAPAAPVTAATAEGCGRQKAPAVPAIEIPVTCYQILGITEKAEKDEIIKSAIQLSKSEIVDVYTEEVSTCRHVAQ